MELSFPVPVESLSILIDENLWIIKTGQSFCFLEGGRWSCLLIIVRNLRISIGEFRF